MLKELYTAAMGMMPQQTRLEITSNNIANANTTGYKRIGIFEQNLIEARNNLQHIKGDAEPGDAPLSQYTDFNLGTLQKTENPLDIALDQDGFFNKQITHYTMPKQQWKSKFTTLVKFLQTIKWLVELQLLK